jgi:hypothetical protein
MLKTREAADDKRHPAPMRRARAGVCEADCRERKNYNILSMLKSRRCRSIA